MIHTQLKAPVDRVGQPGGQTLPLSFPDDIYLGTTRAGRPRARSPTRRWCSSAMA